MRIKIMLPLAFLLFAVSSAKAQYPTSSYGPQWNPVLETERSMSFGSRPCFRLEFANAGAGMVEDQWKDYVKKNFNAKLKKDKKTGEWSAAKVSSAMLGSEQYTIYSAIEKNNNGAALNVWFDTGASFLNRRDNPGRAEEVSRSLRLFYFDVRRAVIAGELKDQEGKLKDLESKQKKLLKDNDGLVKDIESYKAKIRKAEEDIIRNQKDQETTVVDIDNQRKMIEEVRKRMNNVENERN